MPNKRTSAKAPDNSPKVYQREKIDRELKIREFPITPKQQAFLDLVLDKRTRIVFFQAPAGASKSMMSVLSALHLLNLKKISDFFYCRPILESADSGSRLGFLPGEYNSKIAPYEEVLHAKLEELLNKGDIDYLWKDQRVKTLTVNFLRGASLTAKMGIIDEAQNFVFGELQTLLTRIGKYSKYIICADPSQSDLPKAKQGAFSMLFDHFNTVKAQENGIYCVEFTNDDIVRSDLCRFLVEELDNLKMTLNKDK